MYNQAENWKRYEIFQRNVFSLDDVSNTNEDDDVEEDVSKRSDIYFIRNQETKNITQIHKFAKQLAFCDKRFFIFLLNTRTNQFLEIRQFLCSKDNQQIINGVFERNCFYSFNPLKCF